MSSATDSRRVGLGAVYPAASAESLPRGDHRVDTEHPVLAMPTDPVHHPVSSLAPGPGGWVQQADLCLNGILHLAFTAGLVRTQNRRSAPRTGVLLVAAAGAGRVVAGILTTDPVSGYPTGTAHVLRGHSGPEALLHDVAAIQPADSSSD